MKSGSQGSPDRDKSSFGARIGASIGAGNSSTPDIQVKKTLAPIQARPVATSKKPATKTTLGNRTSADLDDDFDESKLPQAIEGPGESGSGKELIWPITVGAGLVILTVSLLLFLSVSRFPTQESPVVRISSSPSASNERILEGQGTWVVSYGNVPEPSPSVSASPSPIEQIVVASPKPQPTQDTTVLPPPPIATIPPPARAPLMTPPPIKPQNQVTPPKLNTPSVKPAESDSYQVQAGPYDDRSAAEAGSADLSQLGKSVKVIEDKGKYFLNLGSPSSQDEALALAEQAVQQGHQVTVKKQ